MKIATKTKLVTTTRIVRPTDWKKGFALTPALLNAGYEPSVQLMTREGLLTGKGNQP